MKVPRSWLLALMTCFGPGPGAVFAQLSPDDLTALRERGRVEGWTFTVDENEATRYPLHELCGAVEPPSWQALATFDNRPATRDLPASFDWRDYNGCTPIRSQGGCGSCWAFGAIGTVESMLQLNEGVCVGGSTPGAWCQVHADCPGGGVCDLPNVDLSEQWLVSCTDSGTCAGGWHTEAYEYLKLGGLTDPCGQGGAVLEADFPYVAWDAPCTCPYPHPHSIWSWAVVGPEGGTATVEQIKQAIMDHGPVSTCVHVSNAFQAYNGGVFNYCEAGGINHCVDLVGWDDNQGSAGVWFLRNSWGTSWGEQGYMRIEYYCNRIGYATCYVNYSPQDCNGNTIPDRCDISCESTGGPCDIPGCGASPDCNGNKLPDECDLGSGLSTDHNTNGVPDECEPDCNGNAVPDECDVSCAGGCAGAPNCGASADCQPDGVPDECQILGMCVPAPPPPCYPSADNGQPWCDDLESYALGTIGGNNWEGWNGNTAALGTITDEQNHTPGGAKSLKIESHDTVHLFSGYNLAASAYWVLRAFVYVPSAMTGDAYFIVNPDYPVGTTWSVQLKMNTSAGTIGNHYGPESLPLVTNAWAEIRSEINFGTDLITIYYDGQFLASYPWTAGGGSLAITTIDLFSPESSGFYYDDLSLFPAFSNDCNGNDMPDDCDPDCNANDVPDDCDLDCSIGECAGHPFGCGNSVDCNANEIPDECDIAEGTSGDSNGNGIPDECEVSPPWPAPPPHDETKNRYVSFAPNSTGPVAFRVEMTASAFFPSSIGLLGWVGEPAEAPEEPGLWTAGLDDAAFTSTDWPAIVHIGDCEIVSAATYEIRAVVVGDPPVLSEPLVVPTTPAPLPKHWGDVVGPMARGAWTSPDGTVNMDDVMAAVQKFMEEPTAPHLTWVDVNPEVPDAIMNFEDIFWIVQGFKAEAYPFPDPSSCP